MHRLFLVLFSICLAAIAHAAECPLGAKDDHLTLPRVMRNFGRFVSDADLVAVQAKDDPGDVTDDQLSEAADKLQIAAVCAQAVLDHPNGDMLPDKANELQGDERAAYVEKFLEFMTRFRKGLDTYRQALTALLATPKAARNFSGLYTQYKFMDDLANQAHHELGGGDGS